MKDFTVTRHWVLVVCASALACKGKQAPPPAAATAQPPAPAPDAAASGGVVIGPLGVGGIVDYQWGNKDEDLVAAELESALAATAGLKVSFAVMDTELGEEGYFSVQHGDTEVAQVMRTMRFDPDPSEGPQPAPVTVRVIHRMIPTHDGLRVGDKLSAVVAKRPDLACVASSTAALGLLTCQSAAEPEITFVVDAEGYDPPEYPDEPPVPPSTIGDREIYMIVR